MIDPITEHILLTELFKTNHMKKTEKQLSPLTKAYRNQLGNCAKNKDEKQQYVCYIKTAQKYISTLRSAMNKLRSKCNNEKDKQGCINAVQYNINSKINSEQHEIKLWNQAIKEIKSETR
jgi:hypothetical protein